MARLLYGGTGADVLITDEDDDGDVELATGTYTAWTTRTGATQVTDLQTLAGAGTTTIVPDADGRLLFFGPDGYTAGIWLRDEAHTSNTRWLVLPNEDLPTRVGTTDHGVLIGLGDDDHTQYFNTTRGDARYTRIGTTQVIPATTFTTEGDLLVGTGNGTYTRLPRGTALQIVRRNAGNTGLEYFSLDLTAFTTAAGSVGQFADVTNALTMTEGFVLAVDDGLLNTVDLSNLYVGRDPSTGFPTVNPKYYVPTVVINEGGTVPADFPAGGLVFVRPAPVLALDDLGKNAISSATSTNFTTLTSLSIGDYAILGVVISAETPTTLPTVSATIGGGGVVFSQAVTQLQGSTAATYVFYGRATSAVSAGTTVTVTCSATRSDIAVHGARVSGLVATAALDQTGIGGSGAATALVAGPTQTTAQANEVAVGVFGYNATIGGAFTEGAGWTQVGTPATSTDAAPRSVILEYQIRNAAGAVTATGSIPTGGTPWSGVVATFKAA